MVYSIGLTGNIASGKSTVAQLFSQLGIDVIYADKISRELTAKHEPAYEKIASHFGPKVLLKNGDLDRRMLRDIIFKSHDERIWLEQLLHPPIRARIEESILQCRPPYCLVEIPLLIHKNDYPYLNKILWVNAPIKQQIERVITRDHCTKDDALAILSTQPSINSRIKIADDIIENDSDLNNLKRTVHLLHKKYTNQSKL